MRRDTHLRPPCPRAARLASWLLLGVALFSATDTAVAGLAQRHLAGATGTFLALPDIDYQLPQLDRLHSDLVYDAFLAAAIGVVLALLGVAILFPWRYARWTATAGAAALILVLPVGYAVSRQDAPTVYAADPRAVRQATADLLLSWYPTWRLWAMVVEVVALLIVTHELLSFEAHDYYRRLRPDGWPGLWSFVPDASAYGPGRTRRSDR